MMLLRLGILSLLLSLSACGFQLRGLSDFPQQLSNIHLLVENLDSGERALVTQALQRAGVSLVGAESSAVRLRVSFKTLAERSLADSAGSGSRIVRLARELNYSVIEANGNRLVDNDILTSTQDLEVNENNLLAVEGEKQVVLANITDNLVNQMLRQLQRL
ncbi:MAG: hypothetical protein HKN34_05625 [Gammaproteobacteria bacterium]|nr:hypothetical protein [Gammaproteobacteria bacterium]